MSSNRPSPDGEVRARKALNARKQAAQLAASNVSDRSGKVNRHPQQSPSNQEERFFADSYPTNFTKGLPHNRFGITDPKAFKLFAQALRQNDQDFAVPLGPVDEQENGAYRPCHYEEHPNAVRQFICQSVNSKKPVKVRNWESPLGGHAYDLEGPDASEVAMPPAPRVGMPENSSFCADEMAVEIAEVYAMSLLRDVPFSVISNPDGAVNTGQNDDAQKVHTVLEDLNNLNFLRGDQPSHTSFPEVTTNAYKLTKVEQARKKARRYHGDTLTAQDLFRGSSQGCEQGPYLSQFLLVGTNGKAGPGAGFANSVAPHSSTYDEQDGVIVYGANTIDLRVFSQEAGKDYMTNWASWLDVQNGANLKGQDSFTSLRKFIATPRHLASYVHFDQLYQAYLNAALNMLERGVEFSSGFPNNGHPTRGAFATFGGPHLLSLVTEVASRALKAVRRQKFQIHLRARPENLAAMLTLAVNDRGEELGSANAPLSKLADNLCTHIPQILNGINSYNRAQNDANHQGITCTDPFAHCGHADPVINPEDNKNYLLPMAFPEGSPMHASYGAGHATVAGACVTVLKAFFEMYQNAYSWEEKTMADIGFGGIYESDSNGERLVDTGIAPDCLTLQGELNKLAANIAIGRDMAGVHFYTDYFDSVRMGERVAVGIIQEQMLTYPEGISMRFTSFDGDRITIAGYGRQRAATVSITDTEDQQISLDKWWNRHIAQTAIFAEQDDEIAA